MNLIEQLGGYNAAKAEANAPVKLMNSFSYEQLDKELLEYRRANNIFEAGDKAVLPYRNYRSDVFELTVDLIKSFDKAAVCYRHATDAEIKAGRRL